MVESHQENVAASYVLQELACFHGPFLTISTLAAGLLAEASHLRLATLLGML